VGRRYQLTTVSKDSSALSLVEEPQLIQHPPKLRTRRRVLPFGVNLSSDRTLSQGVLSLADQAVASITNFATGVIIARATSKDEFGLYMLGFTLILLVTDLQTSLIATPYMVYAPRLQGKAHANYTGSTLLHQVLFSLLTMLVLICAACAARFGVGPKGLEPVLWALAAVASLIMLREFVRRICFAGLKLKNVLLFDAFIGMGQICGLLVLAHFKLLSASRAYWLIGATCGLAVLCWLWRNKNLYRLSLDEAVTDLKRNWIFGKWVFASGLLWTASTNLYPWLLAFFHGTAAAGVFAACLGVVSASNPALLGIQNFLGPKIAHVYATRGQAGLRRFILRISASLAVPVSLLALVLIVWGDRFVGLLYGSRYTGNGQVVAVLAVNLLLSAVVFSFSRALFAIERADLDFALNFAAIAIMLTLGLWLVKTYGPLGSAIGLLVAGSVTSVLRVGAFLRLSNRLSKEEMQTR
jgi:O-antigen/teichoic acid export membrane protein